MNSPTLISCSLFRSALDNHPKPWTGTWEDLVCILNQDHQPLGHLVQQDPKKALPALSPATFLEGERRRRAHVSSLQLLCLDVDNSQEVETGSFHRNPEGGWTNRPVLQKVCLAPPLQPAEAVEILEARNITAQLYTTWSHTPAWPRFRVVLPLAAPIPPELWVQATEWAIQNIGLGNHRPSLDMGALRDVARLYFLPASQDGHSILRTSLKGSPLEIPQEKLPSSCPPSPQMAPWQLRLLEQRAKDRGWQKRYHCDLRFLNLAELLRSRGLDVGVAQAYGCSTRWRTHCPWAHEHTHAMDDDAGVILHEPGRFPVWRCAHSHHAHLGFRDILAWAGGAQ